MQNHIPIIGDGAVGTRLLELDPTIDLSAFDSRRFELLRRIHREYVDAGADFLTADTIIAPPHLRPTLVGIARDAADQATDRHINVFLSLNEKSMVPDNDILSLVDGVIIETVIHADNALRIATAISQQSPIDIYVSFAQIPPTKSSHKKGGCEAAGGVEQKSFISRFDSISSVRAIGINCVDISEIAESLNELHKFSRKPLFAQPSVGPDVSPDAFAHEMLLLHDEFNFVITGGCCGTNHNHIAAIKSIIHKK